MRVDWEQIRREHAPRMWSIAWRILRHEADALDCCQDVFAEGLERSQKTPIENWGGYLSWLTTCRAIDALRRRKRNPNQVEIEVCGQGQTKDVGSNLEFEELTDLVRSHLSQLPTQQAESFWLVCVEQMSYREVADQTGLSANTVGVNVHRARQYLRKTLKQLSPENPNRLNVQ